MNKIIRGVSLMLIPGIAICDKGLANKIVKPVKLVKTEADKIESRRTECLNWIINIFGRQEQSWESQDGKRWPLTMPGYI